MNLKQRVYHVNIFLSDTTVQDLVAWRGVAWWVGIVEHRLSLLVLQHDVRLSRGEAIRSIIPPQRYYHHPHGLCKKLLA